MAAGIPEFFAGRDVLVTGATGFMGKVLLEKLLRCCPDIRNIYILVRAKKGVSPAARTESMAKLALFEVLLKQNPNALKKLIPLEGQVNEPNMGLRPEDQKKVIDNVSVVFHLAASLDWRASLKKAVMENVIGTRNVLTFCSKITNLKSFLYTSTAFCHCELAVLEERVYPPPVDPDIVIELCTKLDESSVEAMRTTLLGQHPNCYTFTKCLSETVVERFATQMPISIARPSIVVPILREPCPGWVDTLNGPVGVLVASGKGVMRSMMCQEKHHAEVIPVDICINVLIAIAQKRGLNSPQNPKEIPVYNVTSGDIDRTTWKEVLDFGKIKIRKYPLEWGIWYPDGSIRTNWLTHTLIVFFFQTLPAYFIDFLLLLCFQQTFMVRVQRKINSGMDLLSFFTMREWIFKNDQGMALWPVMNERDKETFYINNVSPVDREAYLDQVVLGARTYCLNEPPSSLKQCRIRLAIQYVVHRMSVSFFYLYIGYLAVQLVGLLVDGRMQVPSAIWAHTRD